MMYVGVTQLGTRYQLRSTFKAMFHPDPLVYCFLRAA